MILPEYRLPPLRLWVGDLAVIIINTLTLQFLYGWADFLPRYSMFMLFAPLCLWLIAKNKWWLVMTASALFWLFFRQNTSFLPFSAWQILFVVGMIVGYYLNNFEMRVNDLSERARKYAFRTVISVAATTFITSVIIFIVPVLLAKPSWVEVPWDIAQLFDKDTVAIGRMALGSIWLTAMYLVFRKYENRIDRITMGALTKFGQNSLFVYSFHAFVLFAITAILHPINKSSVMLNTLYTTATVAIIYIGVIISKKISRSDIK